MATVELNANPTPEQYKRLVIAVGALLSEIGQVNARIVLMDRYRSEIENLVLHEIGGLPTDDQNAASVGPTTEDGEGRPDSDGSTDSDRNDEVSAEDSRPAPEGA